MTCAVRVRFSGAFEPLHGVLSNGLQKAIARDAFMRFHQHHRLVHQLGQHFQDIGALHADSGAHVLRRVERPTTGKHGQPAQHDLLLFGEQVMTPVDGGAQRLMAWQSGAIGCAQHAGIALESVRELLYSQRARARRCQLQSEWDASDTDADAHDAGALSAVRTNVLLTACARSMNSRTAATRAS